MLPLIPLLLCSAQSAPDPQSRDFMEVTPEGAFLRSELNQNGIEGLGSRQNMVTSPRWQNLDGGLAWIGYDTDIGDNGGQLIASRGLNNEGVVVYTSHSPTELFFHDTLNSENPYVAMADRAPVGVAMEVFDIDPGSTYEFEATVSVFDTTGGGTPDWTYTYPTTQNYYGGGVAVSDDAKIIVAWKADPNSGKLLIEAFDRAGNAVSSGTLNDGTNFHARQARLSDDGSRAYFFIGTTAYIYDVFGATMIHSHSIGASFDSHAFSGDGHSFAYGSFGYLRVYQEQAGSWVNVHSENFSGSTYVARLDLDADGSRLGYLVQKYSPAYDVVDVGMIDVPSNTLLWTDTLTAPGTAFQLVASGVEVDDDGEYLAGSTWGDSLNTTPEAFAYDEAGNQTAAIDLPGSAFSVAISPDGEVGVAGSKGVHANTFGNGGAITCFDTFEQNFHVDGVVRSGMSVNLMYGNSPLTATMGFSTNLAPSPTALGVFDIDLSALLASPTFPVPPGSGVVPLNVPANPGLIGVAVHVQGYTNDGAGNLTMTVKASTRVLP
jgi:hypothetical protein